MKTIFIFLLSLLIVGTIISQDLNKAQALFKEGQNLFRTGQFTNAEKAFENSANEYKLAGQTENYVIATVMQIQVLIQAGYLGKAEEKINQILPIADSSNVSPEILGNLYSSKARAEYMLGKNSQSQKDYEKTIKIYLETSGEEDVKIALVQSELALTFAAQGKIDSALFYEQKSISTIKKYEGENSPNLVYPLMNLANIYTSKGDFDNAIKIRQEMLKVAQNNNSTNNEVIAQAYMGLGIAYMGKGEYKTAEDYFLQTIDIFKELYGDNSTKLSSVYINIGNLYNKLNDNNKSLTYYFKAAKILENNNNKSSELSALYNNIGLVFKNQGSYQNAILYFEKAYNLNKELGVLNEKMGIIMSNLGSVLNSMNKPNKAKIAYKKAIKVFSTLYGEHHPKLAKVYLNLASIYYKQHNTDSMLLAITHSINSNYVNYNYDSIGQPIIFEDYYEGLMLLEAIKSISNAFLDKYIQDKKVEDLKKSMSYIVIADSFVTNLRASYFTEADKIRLNSEISDLYTSAEESLYLMYSAGFISEDEASKKMFYYMERNKTSTLLQAIQEVKIQRVSDVPEQLLEKENKLKELLNIYNQKLTESSSADERSFYRNLVLKTRTKYRNLINYYKQNYPDYYNARFSVKMLTLAELKNFLDEQTALLEYFVADTEIFVLYITKDSVKLHRARFNSIYETQATILNKVILSKSYQDQAKYLELAHKFAARLLFFDFSTKLKKLIIVPDGILNTIPFEALLTHKVKFKPKMKYDTLPYLVKFFAISYAYSSTLLYETRKNDYSIYNRKDLFAIAPVFGKNNKQTFNNNEVTPLPGTKIEVDSITSMFEKNGLSVKKLLEKDANEYNFKNELSQNKFKIIHIATHGFVNFESPELSALLMSKSPMDIDDGILYTGEIYNLKLKTELVNLSACETARGKISKGEGVIGLSRAFLYAGAKNMIISLWKVSDLSTTKEMTLFYKYLLEKYPHLQGNLTFAEALQRAKLDMINSKFSHPYYWSAFILIGM